MRKASVEEMLSKATDSSDSIVLLLDKTRRERKIAVECARLIDCTCFGETA